MEENLDGCGYALERRGIKGNSAIARQSTCVAVGEAGGTLRLQRAEVPRGRTSSI